MRIFLYCSVVFLLLLSPLHASFAPLEPSILILNSYHKGYVWSDEVMSGIENSIFHYYPEARISVEYMDTKRNSSSSYMQKLSGLYREKFTNTSYDLIFASDDNAIHFVLNNPTIFTRDTPIVFCGANNSEPARTNKIESITGVIEHSDIEGTLETALGLQPQTGRVVVINDKTTTGLQVAEELQNILPRFSNKLEFTFLEDLPLAQLTKEVEQLPSNTIVLLLAYLRDKNGTYYSPEQTASSLSKASSAPIYSVWDFFFNHGIVGGVMTSGYLHGETAGDMGLQILRGKPVQDIAIKQDGGNLLLIDYRQLQRFNLNMADLPKQAIVKNIKYSQQNNVLILLSYSLENQWNKSILQGIRNSFQNSGGKLTTFIEFMDTKRYSEKSYINDLFSLYRKKYSSQAIDIVITADDNAFRFADKYRNILFPQSPIIFCGVNYLQDPDKVIGQNITGITESYDLLGTIELGLEIFPQTKKLYVINDQSTSGKANKLQLNKILPQLPDQLEIEESSNCSMGELLDAISTLDDSTLILLLSFTTDKNNYRFSYETSIEMIHGRANRPILGLWDFYVGAGIVAGVITSGRDQGKMAGALALDVLAGKDIKNLPVVTRNPLQAMVDYRELSRFPQVKVALPQGVVVINRPVSFFERNEKLVYTALAILALLITLIIFQGIKILLQEKTHKQLSDKAETDDLTGAKTRNYLLNHLQLAIEQSQQEKTFLTLCFFDLDGLKIVNDSYGHKEGDNYILQAVAAIKRHIRGEDVFCRIGGDEFVVVLKGCEKSKADMLCRQINNELQQQGEKLKLPYSMNISCGISSLDLERPQSASGFLDYADQKMYLHKQQKKMTRQNI
ncbi:MAG: diguanylate cyclase (GGDEF)-like protein [Desulforhopalus sp.]|jgi:diguanylate cyclase (GGDEF)-like protein